MVIVEVALHYSFLGGRHDENIKRVAGRIKKYSAYGRPLNILMCADSNTNTKKNQTVRKRLA